MCLEVGSAVGNDGVGCRMGFIEGVGGKGAHLVKQLICYLLTDAVGNTADTLDRAVLLFGSPDKVFALLLHDLVLLFGHGAAHQVRPSVGIASQLAADLHDLLLIDDTSVGDIQNTF